MPPFEVEFACLIPKTKPPDEELSEPFVTYKGTEYRKTLRFAVPSLKPIKSRLKRFWNWLGFVWFHSRSRKCRRICLVLALLILLLVFNACCVVPTLLFKYSSAFRQYVIFDPVVASHASFNEPIVLHKTYDSRTFIKPKNFYVKLNGTRGAVVGVWNLPRYGIGGRPRKDFLAANSTDNYLVFFHDSYGNRRSYTNGYSKLLHLFNVIVFDYRAYGDSYVDDLNEKGLVDDGVQLLKWAKSNVNGTLFVWGDSLGSAIAAHAVAQLNDGVCGLMLEDPYATMAEHLRHSWFIAKINWRTPWYKALISDALEENDLHFNISKYIKQVVCPVGILQPNGFFARQFDGNLVSYYSNRSFATNEVTVFQSHYSYFKSDSQLSTDVENFWRSFIRAGVRYCKDKKS